MYSDNNKIIFVHQRKAAGSSVKALFDDAKRNFDDGVFDPDWNESNSKVRDYFKFTVVRNPWDRFISAWKYLKTTRHRSIDDVLLNLPKLNLLDNVLHDNSYSARYAHGKELVTRVASRTLTKTRSFITGEKIKLPHDMGHSHRHITRQQHETVFYKDGRLAVDKVIFLEDINAGLADLVAHLNINIRPTTLRHINQQRVADDYRLYFDTRTLDLFNVIFAVDIKTWGYTFESGPGVPPTDYRPPNEIG